ncbi:MAG: hypothetical protein CL920_33975 [Deltaproteobacteria bacterium]|nr:hypothetical protein [Deltaproteobacteria bacterium]MBU53731.1 hypothetical protein [Deltaproteobacteria bacterium]
MLFCQRNKLFLQMIRKFIVFICLSDVVTDSMLDRYQREAESCQSVVCCAYWVTFATIHTLDNVSYLIV